MNKKIGLIILSFFIISIIGSNTSITTPTTTIITCVNTTTIPTAAMTTSEMIAEPYEFAGDWEWIVAKSDTKT